MAWLFAEIRLNFSGKTNRYNAYADLLANPLVIPKPNGLCCPVCEIGYYLGGRDYIESIEGEICCYNPYPALEDVTPCNPDYRIEVGTLLEDLADAGFDMTPFTASGLDELNPYLGVSFSVLLAEFMATFGSDLNFIYSAFLLIINNGFYIICDAENTYIGLGTFTEG